VNGIHEVTGSFLVPAVYFEPGGKGSNPSGAPTYEDALTW
jgi:hypothetical protein